MSDDDWVELAACVLIAVLVVVVWRAFVGAGKWDIYTNNVQKVSIKSQFLDISVSMCTQSYELWTQQANSGTTQ